MIRKFSVAVVFAVLFGSPSFAQDAGSQKFLKEAIEGNLAEVEMGKLSQKQGASEGVRAFGQMLEKDHSDANQKATAVANSVGMTAPTAPNKKQKADYDKMSKLSGANFDKAFAAHMVADHKKDIKEYEKAAKKQDAVGNYDPQPCELRTPYQISRRITLTSCRNRLSAFCWVRSAPSCSPILPLRLPFDLHPNDPSPAFGQTPEHPRWCPASGTTFPSLPQLNCLLSPL
jgi:putative membrane protein